MPPIDILPDDVLGSIFAYLVPSNATSTIDRRVAPWVLTYVCSRWRAAAIAHRALWATIHMDFGDVRNPLLRQRVHLLLKRSGSHPLRIRVHQDLKIKEVVNMLAAEAYRWRDVVLLDIYTCDRVSRLRVDFPALESLVLAGDKAKSSGKMVPTFRQAAAPRLVHYKDFNLEGEPRSTRHKLPFRQLKSYESCNLVPLRSLASVEKMTLRAVDGLEYLPRISRIRPSFGSLTNLTIMDMHRTPLCSIFFSLFQTPNLRRLRLYFVEGQTAVLPTFGLRNLMPPTMLHVLELDCHGGYRDRCPEISREDARKFLDSIPTVEELHVFDTSRGPSSVLMALQSHEAKESEWTQILPNLRTLRLKESEVAFSTAFDDLERLLLLRTSIDTLELVVRRGKPPKKTLETWKKQLPMVRIVFIGGQNE
ncbi:hypothetical protein CYLTODRAFT_421874 [Cylindrobasidium torrendii FP15055 ss-10]|uniref:Uncharacterized protein n=1 Tax=Cylindrobasidium torrendii FP15055 ss-10 TaxID=1314674 RepID=A0A0D7BD70_9AGAR|nr:hypothetical protein CYLTODRAFT_421874 [Cylindrobasidium torrendii FP15055 ss-10]